MTRRQGRRCHQPLYSLKETTWYWKQKEKPLYRTLWRTRFGRGYGPVLRQTAEWRRRRWWWWWWRWWWCAFAAYLERSHFWGAGKNILSDSKEILSICGKWLFIFVYAKAPLLVLSWTGSMPSTSQNFNIASPNLLLCPLLIYTHVFFVTTRNQICLWRRSRPNLFNGCCGR